MSKCLRCGAGNEWIEPVAKEAMTTKPKRKRPKVRSGLSIGSYTERGRPITTGAPIMSTARAKRPKVRYVADRNICCPNSVGNLIAVYHQGHDGVFTIFGNSRAAARRIAAALNVYEARRRGELT